jgi:SAM-dependent methyltransferase
MKYAVDRDLEQSAVVANCRMNRERNLIGSNGYAKELGFNPLEFLRERRAKAPSYAWLDLCCGSGKALIEAAHELCRDGLGSQVEIVGVDLVGMFPRATPVPACLRLLEASVSAWHPGRTFDLITCVHGLHYVGDKLGFIARAAGWLVPNGMFMANLDLANLKFGNGTPAGRRVISDLRRAGFNYDRRKRLLLCRGKRAVRLRYRYIGANDEAGANYTGQPAVDSYYEPSSAHGAARRPHGFAALAIPSRASTRERDRTHAANWSTLDAWRARRTESRRGPPAQRLAITWAGADPT